MTTPRPRRIVWFAVLALGTCLLAQEPPAANGDKVPPLPPPVRAPVQFFRELLAATPARRDEMLAGKRDSARELILRRVREHEALSPAGREEADFQLQLAEFRFYLSPLLPAAPADRAALLAKLPDEYRTVVADRLKAWDGLSSEARRTVLESDQSLRYFVRQETADPERLKSVLAAVPAAQRAEVEGQFARWKALSDAERAERTRAFRDIFDLQTGRREKILGRVEAAERRNLERALEQYSQLSTAERERSLAGFDRFSHLSPDERADFLRNAARWQAMSPEERSAWRRLVLNLPPPPPLPPLSAPISPALVSTNRP